MHSEEQAEIQSRQLSVRKWHELAKAGASIPMRTMLDGISMYPLVRRNRDYVTIIFIHRELMIGDIVLFVDIRGKYVVHRVYQIEADRVQTWGDNCDNPDAWMPYSDVLGLAVRLERGEKTYSLDTPASRRFGKIWIRLHPLRISIRRAYRFARRALGRIKRKLFGESGS